MSGGRINFDAINAAALARYPELLEAWLPGGRLEGMEYVCASSNGGSGQSFKVNTESGVWAEFNGGEGGSDPVSLLAHLNGIGQGEAANELAREFGVEAVSNGGRGKDSPRPGKSAWTPVLPVPEGAPPPLDTHSRLGESSARWSYRDAEGRALGYAMRFDGPKGKDVLPLTYCRSGDGKCSWRWKAFDNPRPLYGLDRLAVLPQGGGVLMVEGEKAAHSAQAMADGKLACMTWPGGCKAVAKAGWGALEGRRVCLWPDADEAGFKAALDVVARLSTAGAVSVSIVLPPNEWPKGHDLADVEGWDCARLFQEIKVRKMDVEAFRDAAQKRYGIEAKIDSVDTQKRGESQSPQRPYFPFSVKASGIYFLNVDDEGDVTEERVCSPLAVVALARDQESQEWGRVLDVTDPDGNVHRWTMPMSMLSGNGDGYRSELLGFGLEIEPGTKAKNRLHQFVSLARPEVRARCVNRTGWHGLAYVLPDFIMGQTGEVTVLQGARIENPYRVAGSLEEWQGKVAALCVGNSRLAFAVSCALAGPLLYLAGAESGGFHFVGGSSLGKTTALRVAGSVCGGGGIRGFIKSWRATDNALESVAALHCDSLLCLDELSQADPKSAGETAYMLANGQGKGRANRDGSGRTPKEWRVLFLSTGEVTLADKLRENGRGGRVMAGQAVRVVDIAADAESGHGLFESLHNELDGAAFALRLNEAAAQVYGVALRSFLERITDKPDEVARLVAGFCKEFAADYCPTGADGQVQRVCQRFGLVAAAGELAASFGVLPWPQWEARDAAVACFRSWLEGRGGVEPAEVREGIAQVRAFIEAHGSSRFEDWDGSGSEKVVNRAGFRRKDELDQLQFYVMPEAFRREVCAGFNPKTLARVMVDRGILQPDGAGKFQVSVKPPNYQKARFYLIHADKLEEGENA